MGFTRRRRRDFRRKICLPFATFTALAFLLFGSATSAFALTPTQQLRRAEGKNVGFGVQEEVVDLKIGTIVNNDNEAYNLYNHYAISNGFSVRKGKLRYKQGTSIIRERIFYCSKEGVPRDDDMSDARKIERLDTRCGCGAHARFKVENGVWELDRIDTQHNHPLAPPEQRHLLRSGRMIPETTKGVIETMMDAGIGATSVYNYLANEAGGVQNMGHTKQDHYNHVQKVKSKKLDAGDAQSLLNYFKQRQVEDPMFFYSVQLDEKKRLKNFFWRDGLSKIDYECFGDVVVFDTTYRTNKYNMICAPFVGVNHHWKNVFFGCALLADETIPTFVWLLQTYRTAMGNRPPKTIFTDQDHAMKRAIREVFPNTRHRLCIWHILKNAGHHLSHLYSDPVFKAKFKKLFHSCESDLEFEYLWKQMVEKYGVGDNTWLEGLYNIRENWCPAFSLDIFSANIKSTQRSESTNNVFQKMACKTMPLTEFVKHYDKKAQEMRDNEISDDFSSSRGMPKMHVRCGIIKHAAEVYTLKIFKKFQDEFLKGVSEVVVNFTTDGTCSRYVLKREDSPREHNVHFNSWNNAIHCSCKMFESKGWLCCHALRVLNVDLKAQKIPPQYILERWTKKAKHDIMMEILETKKLTKKPSKTIRLNKLMRKALFIMNVSAEDDNTEQIAIEYLDQILKHIGSYKADLKAYGINAQDSGNITYIPSIGDDDKVLDPPCKRAKGEKNVRKKDPLEKKKGRGKKKAIGPLSDHSPTILMPKEMSSSNRHS